MSDTDRTNAIPGAAVDRLAGEEIADRELVDRLHLQLLVDGGFTVDARRARPVRSGVAVCVYPAKTLSFRFAEWSDPVVLAWVRSSRRFVRAAGCPELYLGGWHVPDRDHVDLDLVRVIAPQRRRVAEQVGRLHRQRAVFDLTEQTLVPLAVT